MENFSLGWVSASGGSGDKEGNWEKEIFRHYKYQDGGFCYFFTAAAWLIVVLLNGRAAKDGRLTKAQTLLILHSHKTLTYLLCRLTGSHWAQCPWKKAAPISKTHTGFIINQLQVCLCLIPELLFSWRTSTVDKLKKKKKKDSCGTCFCRFTSRHVKLRQYINP